jgi:hypothetical protein
MSISAVLRISVTDSETSITTVAAEWAYSAEVWDSMDNYRQTIKDITLVDGIAQQASRYDSQAEMIVGLIRDQFYRPAIAQFSPPSLVAAEDAAAAATAAADAARAALSPPPSFSG